MKTRELIEQLMKADPSGELECCVNNVDIYFVAPEVGYWDGCQQVLLHDESRKPFYSIIGVRFNSKETKINLTTVDWRLAISDDPDDFIVEYDSEYTRNKYEVIVEKERQAARDAENSVDRQFFVSWAKEKFTELAEDYLVSFAEQHIFYTDARPAVIEGKPESILDRMRRGWEIRFKLVEGRLIDNG